MGMKLPERGKGTHREVWKFMAGPTQGSHDMATSTQQMPVPRTLVFKQKVRFAVPDGLQ